MANATVTFTCGHHETVTGRNRAEAARKVKWLTEKGGVCRDCEYAATISLAHEAARTNGWPALHGQSTKQVDFAAVKRAEALKALPVLLSGISAVADGWRDTVAEAIAGELPDLYRLAVYDAGAAILHSAPTEADARFWLDSDLIDRVASVLSETMIGHAKALAAEGLIDQQTRDFWMRLKNVSDVRSSLRSVHL